MLYASHVRFLGCLISLVCLWVRTSMVVSSPGKACCSLRLLQNDLYCRCFCKNFGTVGVCLGIFANFSGHFAQYLLNLRLLYLHRSFFLMFYNFQNNHYPKHQVKLLHKVLNKSNYDIVFFFSFLV